MRTALLELAEALGGRLPDAGRLLAYAELVARWNRRTNLVGAVEARELVEVLFADALVLADLLREGVTFADVGAGAGAPALPLLELRPDLRGLLVEPRRKRVAFLRTAIGSMELTDRATVLERRLEDGALPPLDVALSRATFAPHDWVARGAAIADRVVVLGVEELPAAPDGLRLERERRYALPFSRRPRIVGQYGPMESSSAD